MNDKSDEKLDRLFTAVRNARPDTSDVERYFVTRLMARILEKQCDRAAWPVLTWRMILVFAMVVVILVIASVSIRPEPSGDYFAAITNEEEGYMARF